MFTNLHYIGTLPNLKFENSEMMNGQGVCVKLRSLAFSDNTHFLVLVGLYFCLLAFSKEKKKEPKKKRNKRAHVRV